MNLQVKEDGEIDAKELQLTDKCLLRMSIKSSNGITYLDVRKWFKFANQDSFLPSKKGIMLETKEWAQIIENIGLFIEAYKIKEAA